MTSARGKAFARESVWLAALFLACFVMNSSIVAQLATATISGAVRDSTAAVIPGVAVTVTNVDTGATRSGTTASDGSFRFPALPGGPYEVGAENPGFQRTVRSGLNLKLGQDAVINLTLQVGEVEQSVAVTAAA